MASNGTGKSTRFVAIAAVIGVCVVAALFAASMWQENAKQSKIDEAESSLLTASLIVDAQADGAAAAALLNGYVVSGDEALIPEIQSSASTAVENLSSAIAEAGSDEGGFLIQGASAIEALSQVIALRQVGDVQAAAAALEELSPSFNALIADLDAYAASERAAAVAATNSAGDANTTASWLAIGAGSLAVVMALAAVAIVVGSLRRRGTVGAPSTS
jgi:CHASE3 domain sensor protein